MEYEPDFNDLIDHEPIEYGQFKILRRLTDLSDEKILSLSREEAKTFINAIRTRYIQNSMDWLQQANRRRHEESVIRKNKVLEGLKKKEPYLSASVEILVVSFRKEKE